VAWVALLACGGASEHRAKPSAGASTTPAPSFVPTSFDVTVTGHGRPVLFIPGLTCDGHVWDATVAHLGPNIQAHVLSLAGFAGRPAIGAPLLPTVHDELLEYIRANHLEKPIVVGHSIGGFMTYWLAATAPDLIAGGVAVDGAPFLPGLFDPSATTTTAEPIAAQMRAMVSGSPEQFATAIRASTRGLMREPDKHPEIVDRSVKSDPKVTGDTMYFVMQTDLRTDVAKIQAPILVLAADTDGAAPRTQLEAVWRAQVDSIPHHELVVIEHSKHFVMLDQPDAFYAALDAFLAKH
jgi:pimeloyl-ACP methyl ester carboxylesterase